MPFFGVFSGVSIVDDRFLKSIFQKIVSMEKSFLTCVQKFVELQQYQENITKCQNEANLCTCENKWGKLNGNVPIDLAFQRGFV